ncbi:MAG: ATP-binding cassette domain-containing protein [Chitinivibrionales bacterium]|nr:ATP-binding cassette domain-containing protein [Chitinivibrionales bacterium]
MATHQSAVQFNHVSFAYDTRPVLERVDVCIDPHEIVVIVGPNGSGKTTLLKLMLGLIKPTTGSVSIFGRPPERAREHVGYVPQQTLYDPDFPVSAMDVVLMGRLGGSLSGRYSSRDREMAREALDEVGLGGSEDRPFADLSGGMRQRVLIARGLVSAPKLLLLDEPTSNVDQSTVQRLYQVLKDLSQRMTVVFVSHDVGLVSSVVDSVVCVNRLVAVHPISELTGETLARLYGGDMSLVRHDHRCAETGHSHD